MDRGEQINSVFCESLEKLSKENGWVSDQALAEELQNNLPPSIYDRLLSIVFGTDRRYYYLHLAAQALKDKGAFNCRIDEGGYTSYISINYDVQEQTPNNVFVE